MNHPSKIQAIFRQRGQGMTEYIIIVALIAIAAIGVFMFFGGTIRNQMAGVSQELAGNQKESDKAIQSAGATALSATMESERNKGMATYNENQGAYLGGGQ
jgi:Flp pilus assembly pilin Flp